MCACSGRPKDRQDSFTRRLSGSRGSGRGRQPWRDSMLQGVSSGQPRGLEEPRRIRFLQFYDSFVLRDGRPCGGAVPSGVASARTRHWSAKRGFLRRVCFAAEHPRSRSSSCSKLTPFLFSRILLGRSLSVRRRADRVVALRFSIDCVNAPSCFSTSTTHNQKHT